jgi:hypothetical protein
MPAAGDLDRGRILDLHARELARFREARPATLAMLGRARAHMPNGTPMSWMAEDNDQPVYLELLVGLLGVLALAVPQLQHRRVAGVEQVAHGGGGGVLDAGDPPGVVGGAARRSTLDPKSSEHSTARMRSETAMRGRHGVSCDR